MPPLLSLFNFFSLFEAALPPCSVLKTQMSQFPIGSEISDVLIAPGLGDYQRKQLWRIDHHFKTRR